MSHVFISYSHKDSEYAHKLADALKEAGVEVWIDGRIDYGTAWPRVIQENLDASGAFVVVMTPRSYDSDWVQNELNRAKRKRIPIFPLLLEGDEPWLSVEALQYVDVRNGALPPPRFFMALRGVLRLSIGSGETAPPQPSPPAPLPKGEGRKPPPETRAGFKPAPTTPLQLPDLSAILPPPFEWCPIPAGQVTLEEGGYVPKGGQTFDVPAFAMAKYPITNAQFDVFVKAKDGYADPQWWDYSDDAKAWREKNATPEAPAFGGVGDHPRVNVTWYEAAAFCRWLNSKVPTPNPSPFDGEGRRGGDIITLPTEQQWQRAAQGDDGRAYPWGSDFDAKSCNIDESGIGKTTPVTAYPNGASPFGVMDMAGNVWEWCLTDYNTVKRAGREARPCGKGVFTNHPICSKLSLYPTSHPLALTPSGAPRHLPRIQGRTAATRMGTFVL
ncbi:MAG: hypothetical protein BroJett038_08330 [Chloroflexota bacterium]|nr:MAG: hypothetical protein BroJett038_08330 [Chloroflexota bacterium]